MSAGPEMRGQDGTGLFQLLSDIPGILARPGAFAGVCPDAFKIVLEDIGCGGAVFTGRLAHTNCEIVDPAAHLLLNIRQMWADRSADLRMAGLRSQQNSAKLCGENANKGLTHQYATIKYHLSVRLN